MNEIRTSDRTSKACPQPDYGVAVRRGLALLAVVLTTVGVAATGAADAETPRPQIAGVTLDGERMALGDLRGKPVVINVWSSW